MPLEKGTSRATVSRNISEVMRSYKKKGKIGTSKPETEAKALKQAVAMSLEEARRSGADIPKPKKK